MRETQKIIKYLGIAFAICLVFTIISSIMFSVSTLTNIFDDKESIHENLESLKLSSNAVVLNIDVDSTNLTIKTGKEFEVRTNSEYIESKQEGNQLDINEVDHNWFFEHDDNDLVVYVPQEYVFDAVSINSGAGKITIESLNTKHLFLDLGAGKATIDQLIATEKVQIDSGAGKFTIKNGELNNLKMSMGAGKVSVKSKIYGNSEINCGIGAVNIDLIGNESDYKVAIDEGIGSFKVNGFTKYGDDYGSGNQHVNVDGGIGSVSINLVE